MTQKAIQTHWVVFTGMPASGKTTIIDTLQKMGHACVAEAARAYFMAQISQGSSLEALTANRVNLQATLFDIRLAAERTAEPEKLLFFDRALPDSLAYYRFNRLPDEQVLAACKSFQYHKVFYFEPLTFKQDGGRLDNQASATAIGPFLLEAYATLGYKLIHVPVMPIQERVTFILQNLE